MNKTADLHAITRARLEAAGITGFHINTGLLDSGINQPDVSGFITGNGDSSFVPVDFSGWGPKAPEVDLTEISRPAATIIMDSAPCAGHSQPLQPRNWALEPRDTKLVKRARALANSDIKKIDADDLDALLAPYMHNGLLRTTYERCTGATEYRGPSGRVIAVSIGGHHFARRYTPLALYMQHVGRIKRHMPVDGPAQ